MDLPIRRLELFWIIWSHLEVQFQIRLHLHTLIRKIFAASQSISFKRELKFVFLTFTLIRNCGEKKKKKFPSEIENGLQRVIYACEYGDWYYENRYYLNLRLGKLSMDEYADEFDRLNCLCKLGRANYFNCFLKDLWSRILKNMKKECETMYDAFWEVIRVEHLTKYYHPRKAKLQEGKSPETTKANVVESIVENVKTDIEERK